MDLTLNIWRQDRGEAEGRLVRYEVHGIGPELSFLEMLDVLNEELVGRGERPVEFAHDCREGICGSCGVMIDGIAHGPWRLTATCQLHMRAFESGASITVEPFRAKPFPVVQDLIVDRSALDGIIAAGGYIAVNTGAAPEANSILVPKPVADAAFDAASCIQCGACVAQCPNGAAQLFTSSKVSHLGLLPQGHPGRSERALQMVREMESAGFGSCSNFRECEAVCPKGISIDWIARMNRDFLWARLRGLRRSRARLDQTPSR